MPVHAFAGDKKTPRMAGFSANQMASTLDRDVFSLQAFLSLRDSKFDFLSFGQRLVAVALDLAEMHEDVFLAIALAEAKALGAIYQLHGAGHSGDRKSEG